MAQSFVGSDGPTVRRTGTAARSKEDLLQTVWPDTFVGDDVLKGSISELRRVLEDDAREPTVIQTIPKYL